jgi:hypothetical protein
MLEALEAKVLPSSYIVTSTGDSADLASGTLRAAIDYANMQSDTTTVTFNIPGSGVHTIQPLSELPPIAQNVIIDGYSQPGAVRNDLFTGDDAVLQIDLDGSLAGADASGLIFHGSNITVQGLAIHNFSAAGILIATLSGANDKVFGNFIGTDSSGTLAQGNRGNGIEIDNSQGITIGEEARTSHFALFDPGQRNLISGNGGNGVQVGGVGANQNIVAANYIGTDKTGTNALPNNLSGIAIVNGAQSNRIGTDGNGITDFGEGNVISGNRQNGVYLGSSGTNQNIVAGNFIGADATGQSELGNGASGVDIQSGPQANRIGTGGLLDPGLQYEHNLIDSNGGNGVTIEGGSSNNIISGNFIGTDSTGAIGLGNLGRGVVIESGSQSNRIGGLNVFGLVSGGNVIANSRGSGVLVLDSGTTGNNIRFNSIFGNQIARLDQDPNLPPALGIDLGGNGPTLNQHGGSGSGPNDLLNYPIIKSATPGSTTAVSGKLNSVVNTTFNLDFYASPSRDPSFFGQGKTYLGSTSVTTDAFGNATFNASLPGQTTAGEWITATATDPNGNTSEFSLARPLPDNEALNPTSWVPIGPVGFNFFGYQSTGRVTAAAADPANVNVMYVAGEHGGIWQTTDWLDGSPTWTPLTDDMPSLRIGHHDLTLFRSPDGTVIYAAASAPRGGIVKLTNDGTGFTSQYLGTSMFAGSTFGAIVVDPFDGNTVYAAVDGGPNFGVWKSTDGGNSWGASNFVGNASDLVIDPNNPSTLYAAFHNTITPSDAGIWKSTDSGASWNQLTNGIPTGNANFGFTRLSFSAATIDKVLYATVYNGDQTFVKRYKSTGPNVGDSWTVLADLPNQSDGSANFEGCCNHTFLAADPNNPSVVYASGDHDMFQSVDGGDSWIQIDTKLGNDLAAGVDPQQGYFDALGELVWGDDGGLYSWNFKGVSVEPPFERKQGNLGLEQFINLALDPSNPDAAYGIAYDKPVLLSYNGQSLWNFGEGSSPTFGGFNAENGTLIVDSADPTKIYLLGAPRVSQFEPGAAAFGFFRSDDSGANFVEKDADLRTDVQTPMTALAEDPNKAEHLILGAGRIYDSLNRGESWVGVTPSLPDGIAYSHIAIPALDSSVFYASSTDGRLYLFSQNATVVNERDAGLPIGDSHNQIAIIQVDPNDTRRVYVVTGPPSGPAGIDEAGSDNSDHVWMTADAGQSWNNITGDLPPDLAVHSLAVDWRFDQPVLYAATDRGVYSSQDNGATWSIFAIGLPNTIVNTLTLMPNENILAAGTYGRGAYEIEVDGPPAVRFSVSVLTDPHSSGPAAGVSFPVQVIAEDSRGFVVPGYNGAVHLESSDPSFSLDYPFQPTDAGVHTFNVILTKAGPETIFVMDSADNSVMGTASVSVSAGPADHIRVADFTPATAGLSTNFLVEADDVFGNIAMNYAGTVHFSSSDSTFSLPDYTFQASDFGARPFDATLKTAGTQTITVTDSANSSIMGSGSVDVAPAAASQFLVNGFPTTIDVGGTGVVKVTALDPFDNVVTGYTGMVHFTSTDPLAVRPADSPLQFAGYGFFSITLNSAGTHTITATDTTNNTITGSQSGIVVGNPVPAIMGLSAASAVEGSSSINIALSGSGFVASSVVRWNDTSLQTTFVSGTLLEATIPTELLSEETNVSITVSNPGPGGGSSNAETFSVTDAPIHASGVNITSAAGSSFTGTVAMLSDDQQNSAAGLFTATINWGDSQSSTGTITAAGESSFNVSGTHTYSAGGNYTVHVALSDLGGSMATATSSATVSSSTPPAITGLSVTSAVEGQNNLSNADLPLTVTGAGFVSGSQVLWKGSPLTTTFVSATELQTAVPPANLAEEGTASITVSNAGAGGRTSNAQMFTITDAPIRVNAPHDLTATAGTSLGLGLTTTLGDANVNPVTHSIDFSDFTAINIAWGDGQSSAATLEMPFHSGPVFIDGSHTYVAEGRYTITITAQDVGGSLATGTITAHVARTGPAPRLLPFVASTFTHSPEYYSIFVTNAYLRYLGRRPDPQGLQGWVIAMSHGLTDERLEAGFIGSPEYINNHGGQGAGWIRGMYMDLLGRSPAQSEVDGWLAALAAGESESDIAYGFAASDEREGIRVQADYNKYLGRTASATEVAGWVLAFHSGAYMNEDVVAGFVGAPEYFQRHYDNIADWLFAAYGDILNRPPDDAGYAGWLAFLRNT